MWHQSSPSLTQFLYTILPKIHLKRFLDIVQPLNINLALKVELRKLLAKILDIFQVQPSIVVPFQCTLLDLPALADNLSHLNNFFRLHT